MSRRDAAFAVILFSLLLTPLAAASPFFGPKSYTIAAGKPQTFIETVPVASDASCDDKAAFVLLLQNAGIASGAVSVNGVEIIHENDFPNVPAEVPIRMGATNTITVQLNGGMPGSTLTLSIRRDIEAPLSAPSAYTLTGKAGTFTATSAVGDTSGVFVLEVANGDAAGHQVSSGSITLNGSVVINNKELTKSTSLLRRMVVLQNSNTLRTDLKGSAGDVVTVALRRRLDASACVAAPQVAFVTPATGALINAATLVATGTTTGPPDVGVNVNGIAAQMDLEHRGTAANPYLWAAELTPDAGTVELIATATTGTGARGTANRMVVFAPAVGAPELRAEPDGGLAPLSVTFRLSESLEGAARYEADLDGDGVYEISSVAPPQLATTYATPGLRVASVRVTLQDGSSRVASEVVSAQSFSSLDTLFTAIWRRFLGSIAAQDIDGALTQVVDRATRDKYRGALTYIFTLLPIYAASVQSFRPMELGGDSAHYLLIRKHQNGDEYGYHVYFIRDADGVWKIVQF
jgi:hypothetical protein